MSSEPATSAPAAGALPLHRLMTGYLSSRALFAAVEHGLFDALGKHGPSTAEEVARQVGLPERPVRALLLAMEGEQLVSRDGEVFANSPTATTYLTADSPTYMGALARHQNAHFTKLARLDEALRSDEPIVQSPGYTGEFQPGPQVWARRWAEVFRASAQLMAEDLASALDLSGRRRVVDLGCASGSYSAALARANPGLPITAVDQPAVAEVAREFIAEADLADRIEVRPANIFADRFADHDVALLSHVIQGFGRDRARTLLAHVYDWLPPGGLLVLHSHLPEQATLPFPYQFGLILLINNNQGGEPHGEALTRQWLNEIGFHDVRVTAVSPISALCTAVK